MNLNITSVAVEAIPSNPQQPTASTDPRIADLFTCTMSNAYLQSFLVQSAMVPFSDIINLRAVRRTFRDKISTHGEWQIRIFRLFIYNVVLNKAAPANDAIPSSYIDMIVEPDIIFAKARKIDCVRAESAAIRKRAAQDDELSEKAVHNMIHSIKDHSDKGRLVVDYLVYQGSLGKIEVLPEIRKEQDSTRLQYIENFPFFHPQLLTLVESLEDMYCRGKALVALAKLRAKADDPEAINEALKIAERIVCHNRCVETFRKIALIRAEKNDAQAIDDALRILYLKEWNSEHSLDLVSIVKIILDKGGVTAFDTASRLASTISDQYQKDRAFMHIAFFCLKRGGPNAHSDAEALIRDNVSERNLPMAYDQLALHASKNTLLSLTETLEFLQSRNLPLKPWLLQKYAALDEEYAIERAYSLLPLVMEKYQEQALRYIAIERAKKSDRGAMKGALHIASRINDRDCFIEYMTEIIKVITPHHLPVAEEPRHIFARYYTWVQKHFCFRQPTA